MRWIAGFSCLALLALAPLVCGKKSSDPVVAAPTPTAAPTAAPTAYERADGDVGGMYFNMFYSSEAGWDQADPNIAAVYRATGMSKYFRCVGCHGNDLLGRNGVLHKYVAATSANPQAPDKNLVTFATGKTDEEILASLKTTTGRRAVSIVSNPLLTIADAAGKNSTTVGNQTYFPQVKFRVFPTFQFLTTAPPSGVVRAAGNT
jgi:mono/diheme cytochrome c family protein